MDVPRTLVSIVATPAIQPLNGAQPAVFVLVIQCGAYRNLQQSLNRTLFGWFPEGLAKPH
jgi:hypothetical protein